MKTLAEKILAAHCVAGELKAGMPIEIKIDQTLTQDATGTMAYLQFEAMGCERVKTECSVSYVDHNTLQNGFENADDHQYLLHGRGSLRYSVLPAGQRDLPSGAVGAV